jgi:hypothetical protein
MQMQRNVRATHTSTMAEEIESWEDEGGATPPVVPGVPTEAMLGTQNQAEWAEQIKLRVNAEFDRVAAAIRSKADKRNEKREAETEAIIAILENKRTEVMSRKEAGYFIHDWQEGTIRCCG